MAKKTDPLDAWLDRVEAREQWQCTVEHTGATVTAYIINCRLAVAIRYAEGNGWELLVPASNENNTARTLDGAAIALEVDGARGLIEDETEAKAVQS